MSTTAEFAYQSIRKKLLKGDLLAGQRVSQMKFAREFQCSTVPIVEALRRLESEGLLVKEPRKMAKVRTLVAAEVEGLYLVRQAMEMAAARLCANRISDKEIDELRELDVKFEQAATERDEAAADRLDIEIHQFIVRAARCPLLEQELDRLMLIQRTVPGPLVGDWRQYTLSHCTIIEAIAQRDMETAEFLMKKHIQRGYEQMMERASL